MIPQKDGTAVRPGAEKPFRQAFMCIILPCWDHGANHIIGKGPLRFWIKLSVPNPDRVINGCGDSDRRIHSLPCFNNKKLYNRPLPATTSLFHLPTRHCLPNISAMRQFMHIYSKHAWRTGLKQGSSMHISQQESILPCLHRYLHSYAAAGLGLTFEYDPATIGTPVNKTGTPVNIYMIF